MTELEQLFLTMRTSLAKAVASIVPVHEVEDVVQETYVKLCLVQNREQINHPRSYLFRIARNLAKDHVKSASFRLSDSIEDQTEIFADIPDEVYRAAVSDEEFLRFCQAVRCLPLQCRRVFVMRKVYGFSQKEISEKLEIAESTVEKHIAQGLKRCSQSMSSGAHPRDSISKRESYDR